MSEHWDKVRAAIDELRGMGAEDIEAGLDDLLVKVDQIEGNHVPAQPDDVRAPEQTEIYYEQPENFGGPRNLTINGRPVHAKSITITHEMQQFSEVTIVFGGCKITKGD